MSKRKRGNNRCPRCQLGLSLCICADIPRIATRTEVVVIMHYRELRLPTNTGRLAHLCLPNSQLLVRGLKDAPLDLTETRAWSGTPLLLSADADAQLDEDFVKTSPAPHVLVVTDGSWRQASKASKREPALRDLRRVRLPVTTPSRYHLRREPHIEGLSTIEAIARALGALESPEVQAELERIFSLMVERTMRSRGTPLRNA